MFILKTGIYTGIYKNKYSYSQLPANLVIPSLIHFPLLVIIFPVESPHVIGIISIFTPIILIRDDERSEERHLVLT